MKTTFLAVIFSVGFAAPLFADGTNILSDEKSGQLCHRHDARPQLAAAGHGRGSRTWLLRGIKDEQSGGATLLTPQECRQRRDSTGLRQTEKMPRASWPRKTRRKAKRFWPPTKTIPASSPCRTVCNTRSSPRAPARRRRPDDTVTVNYRGTLLDGTEFDSSYKRGQPATFPVGGVIHGWTEALQKMKVGSKWKLFIPSDLAYGEQGQSASIPPNSTLIFEVELLAAQSAAAARPRPPSSRSPATSSRCRPPRR